MSVGWVTPYVSCRGRSLYGWWPPQVSLWGRYGCCTGGGPRTSGASASVRAGGPRTSGTSGTSGTGGGPPYVRAFRGAWREPLVSAGYPPETFPETLDEGSARATLRRDPVHPRRTPASLGQPLGVGALLVPGPGGSRIGGCAQQVPLLPGRSYRKLRVSQSSKCVQGDYFVRFSDESYVACWSGRPKVGYADRDSDTPGHSPWKFQAVGRARKMLIQFGWVVVCIATFLMSSTK